MRFGLEKVEAALSARGRTPTMSEPDERKDAIVRDIVEAMISLQGFGEKQGEACDSGSNREITPTFNPCQPPFGKI